MQFRRIPNNIYKKKLSIPGALTHNVWIILEVVVSITPELSTLSSQQSLTLLSIARCIVDIY